MKAALVGLRARVRALVGMLRRGGAVRRGGLHAAGGADLSGSCAQDAYSCLAPTDDAPGSCS